MCGVMGLIRQTDSTDLRGKKVYSILSQGATTLEDVVESLMESIDSRGGDGCGITTYGLHRINPKGHVVGSQHPVVDFWKTTDRFSTLTKFKSYQYGSTLIKNTTAIIGHTRKGSSGGNTLETTHPIMSPCAKIILSHNGTLRNWREKFVGGKIPISDTAAVVETLVAEGAKNTFESLEGPMTCLWINDEDGTYNVHRSEDRPLSYCVVQGHMLFASEAWMLMKALDRCGIDMTGVEILPFPVNTHIVYDLNTGAEVSRHEYTPCPRTKTTYSCSYSSSYSDYEDRWPTNHHQQGNRVVHQRSNNHAAPNSNLAVCTDQLLKNRGVSDVRRNDWALITPEMYIPNTNRPSEGRVLSYLDLDFAINESSRVALTVKSFNVPRWIYAALSESIHIKLLTKISGVADSEPTPPDQRYYKTLIAQPATTLVAFDPQPTFDADDAAQLRNAVKGLVRLCTGTVGKHPSVDKTFNILEWHEHTLRLIDMYMENKEPVMKRFFSNALRPLKVDGFPNVGKVLEGNYDHNNPQL